MQEAVSSGTGRRGPQPDRGPDLSARRALGRRPKTHYRSPEEVAEWRERDPLPLHSRRLIRAGVGEDELRSLERGVATEIEAAVAAARQAPDPGRADLGIGETLAP